jgi:hypothetical protein
LERAVGESRQSASFLSAVGSGVGRSSQIVVVEWVNGWVPAVGRSGRSAAVGGGLVVALEKLVARQRQMSGSDLTDSWKRLLEDSNGLDASVLNFD